jgi:integrase
MVTVNLSKKHGIAALESFRGRLRIRFPRANFGGEQKYLSLGLHDTPANREIANRKLQYIQSEIDDGKFDPTLERYQPQSKQQAYLKVVSSTNPQITVKELWHSYLAYIAATRKQSTLLYLDRISLKVDECPYQSPFQALEIRDWLLSITTQSMTKRVLVQLNAACKWAIKHKKINVAASPFEGMPQEFKHNYELEANPCAFPSEMRSRIIEAFKTHQGKGFSYRCYAPFVEFLFLTGCRPSEGIGLEWKDIDPDYRFINFDGGIVCTGNKMIVTKGSKNNKSRRFPINERLRVLLQSLERTHSLVFPSPKCCAINYSNFSKRAWNAIVDPITMGTTPYSCRDTFITEQIAKGVGAPIIAKWIDSSVKMIEKHYLDMNSIDHILPQ